MFVIVLTTYNTENKFLSTKVEGPYDTREDAQNALRKIIVWMEGLAEQLDQVSEPDVSFELLKKMDDWLPVLYSESDYGIHTCEIQKIERLIFSSSTN